MARRMSRGKQQVLLNYLPERTFDFERISTIARVSRIRGIQRSDLNVQLILRAVEEQVQLWQPALRPVFQNLQTSADRFTLIEPKGVDAAMFPLVFWCQGEGCGQVVVRRDDPPRTPECPRCRRRTLKQMRFVKVHRCGALEPLQPPQCARCQNVQSMALDTRGSERISSFQWICRSCNTRSQVFPGYCSHCHWSSADTRDRMMSIMVHRAGPTYYPHQAVLLNQPGRELTALLATSHWQAVAAAKHLGVPAVSGKRLVDFAASPAGASAPVGLTLSPDDRARLRERGMSEAQIEQLEQMNAVLANTRAQAEGPQDPQQIADLLERETGVQWGVWERAGHEMLEAVMPLETGTTRTQVPSSDGRGARTQVLLADMGLSEVTLVADFPITNAVYGYSRVDYQQDLCQVNPFPADPDAGGKFPILVNVTQADALLLRLNPGVVLGWLNANGLGATVPAGTHQEHARQAYFVQLFDQLTLRETLGPGHPQARMVFCLLHTLSHVAMRQAGVLCGLEPSSLAEYVLPRTLGFAVYCNHQFGATIGALTALFEQSLDEWLGRVVTSRKCVYDPVCAADGGTCHACLHASETSCRFFNVNLGRQFLFGGSDPALGSIAVGYLDYARVTRSIG